MQTEQIDETAEATLTPAKPRGRGARYRPILKAPAHKAAEKWAKNAAKPLPDIRCLSGTKARENVPKNLRRLTMVHEYCLLWNEPLPDYRSVDCSWNPTKQQTRLVFDELARLHDHAPAVFRRLARLTRNYQATEAGILKKLQEGAKYLVRPHHVRGALRALREAGLVERIPARSATGACGWIVRLKRPSEWPRPFNPGGQTLDNIQAQPGYNKLQGRVVATKRTGKPFRSNRAADQCILDGITGEVLDKASGVVLFIFVHQTRNKWGVARFLGPSAGKLSNKILSQRPHTLYEEIKEEGIKRKADLNPHMEDLMNSFSFPEPTDHRVDDNQPGNVDEPSTNEPTSINLIPEPDDLAPDFEFFDEEIYAVHREWESYDTTKNAGDPDGYGQDFAPENSRYRTSSNGRDVVPDDVIVNLPDGKRSFSVQAPYYLGPEHRYTATIVERWYNNSPEALLVRELTGDDEGSDLVTARLWMRRFVDRYRAGTHEKLYRRLLFIALVQRSNLYNQNQLPRKFTYRELLDYGKIAHELRHEARQGWHHHSIDKAAEFTVSLADISVPEPSGIFDDAEARYQELGATWVPEMCKGKRDLSDYILISLHALMLGDKAHIERLIDATDRSWQLKAFQTPEGIATLRAFRPAPGMPAATTRNLAIAMTSRFHEAFWLTPDDIRNEFLRFQRDQHHLSLMCTADTFDASLLPYNDRTTD